MIGAKDRERSQLHNCVSILILLTPLLIRKPAFAQHRAAAKEESAKSQYPDCCEKDGFGRGHHAKFPQLIYPEHNYLLDPSP